VIAPASRSQEPAAGAGTPGEYYERYWSPDGHCPTGYMYPDLEALLREHVRRGARCLDFGCGDGRTSGLWLREHGREYTGVDVSDNAIADALALGLDARKITDGSELPFADDEFDAALAIEVFEHLFDPLASATELFRVLKPGGVLIATVPNTAYWRRRLELVVGRWNPVGDDLSIEEPWRDPHVRFFTASALESMLGRAGYDSVEIAGHAGNLVRDLPWIGLKVWNRRTSRAYRWAQERHPSVFGLRLNAVARKPSA
jgi:SAM-dependent methyltransferase